MPQTIDLLNKVLELKTAFEWARRFNIVPSAITNARRAGHVSPALTGNFAIELGEDAERWMLAAQLESKQEIALMDVPLGIRWPESKALPVPPHGDS